MKKYKAQLVSLHTLSDDEIDDLQEDGNLGFFYKFQNETVIAEKYKCGMTEAYRLSFNGYSIEGVIESHITIISEHVEEKIVVVEVERKKNNG
jgi:hypothetical protein